MLQLPQLLPCISIQNSLSKTSDMSIMHTMRNWPRSKSICLLCLWVEQHIEQWLDASSLSNVANGEKVEALRRKRLQEKESANLLS